MTTLKQYLNDHKIDPVRLSLEAGVRYLTVWNAVKEKPIFYHNALKIRVTLRRLTGLAYTGPLPTLDEPPIDQLPTIPIRRLKEERNAMRSCADAKPSGSRSWQSVTRSQVLRPHESKEESYKV